MLQTTAPGFILQYARLPNVANFTEFYSISGGDNLSGGSSNSVTPTYTSAAGDSDGTSVFTPNDGSTPASSIDAAQVALGNVFGSVYITIGATVAVFVGRLVSIGAGVNGALTFSTTAKSGTFPANSAGAHTITCKVGGAWALPAAATAFPITFIKGALTNVAGAMHRLTVIGTVNSTVSLSLATSPVRVEGATAAAGDGGMFTVDLGATATTGFAVSSNNQLVNCVVQNVGGSAAGITMATRSLCRRVRATNIGGAGFSLGANTGNVLEQCEADNCNVSNTASTGGILITSGTLFMERCLVHNNAGSNNCGLVINGGSTGIVVADKCAFFNNGLHGVFVVAAASGGCFRGQQCDFYNNGTDGILATVSTQVAACYLENCNFAKNVGTGVNGSTSSTGFVVLKITNCGFGSGADANGTNIVAAASLVLVESTNSISYVSPTNPWNAPATGDFRITAVAAEGAGIGTFLELGEGQSGTVGFPDIGAAQHMS